LKITVLCFIAAVLAVAAPGCGSLNLASLNDLTDGSDILDGEGAGGIDDAIDDGGLDGDADGIDDDEGQDIDNGDGVDDDIPGDDTTDGGDDDADSWDADLEVTDLSVFRQFSFSRGPALGFCPPLDAVYSASIVVNPGGLLELSMSILREGLVDQDVCVGNLVVPCATATQMEARTLTAAEAASVVAAFSQVAVDDNWDPVCDEMAIDPCIINQFSWDVFFATDFECSVPRLPPEQARTLISLLEGLRD